MKDKKETIARILLFFAIATGLLSFWYTLAFTWDSNFAAVNLPVGETHSNYHAFREALLALAVNILIIHAAFKGFAIDIATWKVTMFMAIFYYAGWWLAWPIWGFHAPNVAAELNHGIATICGLAGLALIKPKTQN